MINLQINYLAWSVLFVALFVSSMVLYLVMKYLKQDYLTKKGQRYQATYMPIWHLYLMEYNHLPSELAPKNNIERQQIEVILFSYLRNFDSESLDAKITAFANRHLETYYRKRMKHPKWSIRMNALKAISAFKLDRLLKECDKRIQAKRTSKEEFYEILHIYSKMDQEAFLKAFLKVEAEFSEFEYKKLFVDASKGTIDALWDLREVLSLNCQYSLLEVIGSKKEESYLPMLESLLRDSDSEIRIRSLKAIYAMGHTRELPPYLHFITSNNFVERLMVTRLFGIYPIEEVAPYLEQLKEDKEWLVRQEVAGIYSKADQFRSPLGGNEHENNN